MNKIMKYLNKITSVFMVALLAVLTLTGCEGADLYKVGSPSWLNDTVDSIANSKKTTIVPVTPNPTELGTKELTQEWWSVFTDDVKIEPGTSAQVKFINYGGGSNWNNFVIILRNEAKDYEYGVFRADNWCWATGFTGEESDFFCSKKMETTERDWGAWLQSMSMAKCTATISNPGDGTASIQIVMMGSDGSNYTQEYKDIINVQPDNCYFSFTVDHSYIEFGDIDIVDSEPVSMELKAVPSEVLIGTPIEEAMANVTATVTFANGATKDIENKDLQFEAIPDYGSLGQKTLVVLYNKTYLGAAPEKAVIASKAFSVVSEYSAYTETFVVPTPITLGAVDNTSTPWYEFATEAIPVKSKETKVISFTNYTDGVENWHTFIIQLNNSICFRSDNAGWGPGWASWSENINDYCTASIEDGRDWGEWLAAMNGAKVTAYITNNGDGTADIRIVMIGNNGKVYKQNYIGIKNVDTDNCFFKVCVEFDHVVFDQVLGKTDNSTTWGNQVFTSNIQVISKQECTFKFTNYTVGNENYQNFLVVLGNEAGDQKGVLRADNAGWGPGWSSWTANFNDYCTPSIEDGRDWNAWKLAMNGAKVTLTVKNNGDGTADVKAVMLGNDNNTYIQNYIGFKNLDPDNFYVRLSVDNSHMVFE